MTVHLAAKKQIADPVGEDFGPAARHRLQTGVYEAIEYLFLTELEALAEVVDFGNRKGLDLDVGALAPHRPQQLLVPLERQGMVVPADHVHFVHVGVDGFQDLVIGHLVGVVIARFGRKVTELAREDADVGGVDLDIEDEKDFVARYSPLGKICHPAQRKQIGGLQQGHPLAAIESLGGNDLFPDWNQGLIAKPDLRNVGRQMLGQAKDRSGHSHVQRSFGAARWRGVRPGNRG